MDFDSIMDSFGAVLTHPTYGWIAIVGLFAVVFLLATIIRDEVAAAQIECDGPPRFPIVGNIPYLMKEPWIQFARFTEKYGEVYKL